jgi:hypothetical protein
MKLSSIHINVEACLAEFRKDGKVVPKELGKGVSGLTFLTTTNMDIPW